MALVEHHGAWFEEEAANGHVPAEQLSTPRLNECEHHADVSCWSMMPKSGYQQY